MKVLVLKKIELAVTKWAKLKPVILASTYKESVLRNTVIMTAIANSINLIIDEVYDDTTKLFFRWHKVIPEKSKDAD